MAVSRPDVLNAARRLLFLVLAMAAILCVCAGTAFWTGAWIFIAVWTLCILLLSADMLVNQPALFARRLNAGPAAEQRPEQKRIQAFNSALFIALLVVPGLDIRFGWSTLSPIFVWTGYFLVVLGFVLIDLAFRVNEFAGSTISIASGQTIVDHGPYAVVRHPMYSGTLLIVLGTALALGSVWACLLVFPVALGLGWRLLDEEQVLRREFPRYEAYTAKVRTRLIPCLW